MLVLDTPMDMVWIKSSNDQNETQDLIIIDDIQHSSTNIVMKQEIQYTPKKHSQYILGAHSQSFLPSKKIISLEFRIVAVIVVCSLILYSQKV